MKFRTNTLKQITALQFKEKLDNLVVQVKRADVPYGERYLISFEDGSQGITLLTDTTNDFIHRCDNFAQGKTCSHTACAFAIAEITNTVIHRFGLLDQKDDLANLIGEYEYEDINAQVGLPPFIELNEDEDEEDAQEEDISTAVVTKPTVTAAASTKRNPAKDWSEIEDYLKSQSIQRQVIQQVKAQRKDIFSNVLLTEMTTEPKRPDTLYIGIMLERAIKHILLGESLLLIGDKGTGKDTLVATLSWIFGLPQYLQTGHKGYTAETLVGDNMPTGNGMEVAFKYTAYATSVMNGGLVHFAELNMLLPDATSIFHSVYDGNCQLSTPYGTVDRHASHFLIASMNIGEQYAGIKSLNEALKDRLAVLHMPSTLNFKELVTLKSGLSDGHVLRWMEEIRKEIDTVNINEGIGSEANTIRGYIKAATYLVRFGVTDDNRAIAIEDYVLNRIEDREERYAIRNHLRITCWADLSFEDGEKELLMA